MRSGEDTIRYVASTVVGILIVVVAVLGLEMSTEEAALAGCIAWVTFFSAISWVLHMMKV